MSPEDYRDLDLAERHAEMLAASGIDPGVAMARGYRTVKTQAELKRLGFSASQCRVPALLVPIRSVFGEIANYQIRPDAPRVVKGKALKYETPRGSGMLLDVPPGVRAKLADPAVPLFISEGARKADAAVSLSLCCIAILGVWNWRGSNAHGGLTALSDWESIALKSKTEGRFVYLVFDSDVMSKPGVHRALERLAAFLRSRGARVRVVYLPVGEGGAKTGLDDYLADGNGVDDLLALAEEDLRPLPREPRADVLAEAGEYRERPDGLFLVRHTDHGEQEIRLTNFRARIAADIVRDDGQETQGALEIKAQIGEFQTAFVIPAHRFGSMAWPISEIGPGAVVAPGFGNRDHARAAIQILSASSGPIPRRHVYTHIGLRRVGETWVYLHAGGAIGPIGPITGVHVQLPQQLARFDLPDPPSADAAAPAVRASLQVLGAAPDYVTAPLLGAAYRAPLGTTDFSLHVSGPTGAGKSELAALVAQHYGAGFDRLNLPGSWTSTAASIEFLAFTAKDAPLVVDDFAPGGTQYDVARLNREADRLLRNSGNRAGRGRLAPDGSLRPTRGPRGLILSTGEDIPRGQSIRARTLTMEIGPGDVHWPRVTELQPKAAEGVLALAMSGFLRHVVASHDDVMRRVQGDALRLRDEVHRSGWHKRTAFIIGNLGAGWLEFLRFAESIGAISPGERQALWDRVWNALGEAANRHGGHIQAADPVVRLFELVASAIASGEAHVAAPDGSAPNNPAAWGWRLREFGAGENVREEWRDQGKRIGWVDGDNLYLDPEAALRAAQAAAGPAGDGVPVGSKTLGKRLHERGYLVSTEEARQRNTVRVHIEGKRHTVLHLHTKALYVHQESAQSAQRVQTPDGGRAHAGPIPEGPAKSPTESAREEPAPEAATAASGPIGTISQEGERPTGVRRPCEARGPALHDLSPEEFRDLSEDDLTLLGGIGDEVEGDL